MSDVKHELFAATAERRDPSAVGGNSNAGADADREKVQEDDAIGSSEKRMSTPFNSALSHRSEPEGRKVSGHLAAPDFEDSNEREDVDEAGRARDQSLPTGNADAQEVVDVATVEGQEPALLRREKTLMSDAPDNDCDDAGDAESQSSNEHGQMSVSSDDDSPEPVQRLTRSRMQRDEGGAKGMRMAKKRTQRPAAKGKARPKKIARTEAPSPESSMDRPKLVPQQLSAVKETQPPPKNDDVQVVASTRSTVPKEELNAKTARSSDQSRLNKKSLQVDSKGPAVSSSEKGKERPDACVSSEPEATSPEESGDAESSDDDSPVVRRRRCLRNRTKSQRQATNLEETHLVESSLLSAQLEKLRVGAKSSASAGDVSKPEASTEIPGECPQVPRIDSENLEREDQSLEAKLEAKAAKIDSRSQSVHGFHDETRTGSRPENDQSDDLSPLPIRAKKSAEGSKRGDDSIAPSASEAVKYKMPKPRHRRGLTGLSAHVDHGSVAPSLLAVKGLPQTPQGQHQHREHAVGFGAQSSTRHRFVVDENGKLGQQGIGALSEIVSTPSTAGRPKTLCDTGAGDPGSIRSTRLFRPTNNIYSAKKSGTLSVQKALGSKSSMQVLHTPGARTPGKVVSANAQVYMQPTINSAIANCSTASHSNANLPHDRNASVLGNARSGQGVLRDNRETKGVNRELAFWDPAAEHSQKTAKAARTLKKQLKFSSAEQGLRPGFESLPTASPAGDVHNKVTLEMDSKLFSHLPPQPKTAPGKPGPRPRIERKLVKSALRCRIEKMLAAQSFSTPQVKENENMSHPNDVENCSSPDRKNAAQEAISDDGKDHVSYVCETSSEQLNEGSEVVGTAQQVSAPPEGSAEEEQKHSQGKRISGHGHYANSAAELLGKASDSLSVERITPSQQSGDILSGDSADKSDTHIKSQECIGESVTPDPTTTIESAGKRELSFGEGTGRESAIEHGVGFKDSENAANDKVPGANTLSNLVSSVSSFLPAASNLFGTRTEEKSVSSDAKLAAKRQRQDIERREAEVIARREAQRAAKQNEIEEKQRKAENRRRLMAEAEKHREEERRRKEQIRARKRQEEEERQRIRKEEEDKRKEEHRRHVLEQKRQMDKAAQRKEVDTKRPPKVSKLPRAKLGQHGSEGTVSKLKQYRPGQTHSRLPPTGSSRIAKVLTSDNMPPPPPKTPRSLRDQSEEEEPQWLISGERKRGPSESSSDERERRRQKTIPSWAGSQKLLHALHSEKSDPDALFARGAPSCNLETVFEVDEERKRKYRTRDVSGDWTKDRLTAKEEMEYKRQAGFFDNA